MNEMYDTLKKNGGGMKANNLIVALAPIMNPGTMNIYEMQREDPRIGELEYLDPNFADGELAGRIKSFFYIKP